MPRDPRFNILDYVYEGVWKNHHDPAYRSWTWTLSDSKALLSLACLSILVAFAQTRMWVIARYVVYQRSKSPRLPDSQHVDPRLTLSQGEAIVESLPAFITIIRKAIHRCRHVSPGHRERRDVSSIELGVSSNNGRASCTTENDSCADDNDVFILESSVSPLFGVAAIINIIIFIAMGVVIPWALSNGSLETPIVKSKVTEECLGASRAHMIGDMWANLFQADAILQQCQNRLNDTCHSQYYLLQPKIITQRNHQCPFLGDGICMKNVMTVEITHQDISAYEAGVNSPTSITMNHRLRCAPVLLDKFYVYFTKDVTSDNSGNYTDAPTYTRPDGRRIAITGAQISIKPKESDSEWHFGMNLRTLNGPHWLSDQNSGRLLAEERIQSDLTVLPRSRAEYAMDDLLPMLQLPDASPFLIVYRGGATEFLSPVDDPFFSAHNLDKWMNLTYYPDYEATALGCAEQFQFCRNHGRDCTPWGRRSTPVYRLFNFSGPSNTPNGDEVADILALFRMLPTAFSVEDYLADRLAVPMGYAGVFPLVSTSLIWGPESWVLQLETWFTKAILGAILYIRYGVKAPLDKDGERLDGEWKRKFALCGRVLFQHPGYTNINWIGAWCTIGALVFVSIGSYATEAIHKAPRKVMLASRRILPLLRPLLFLRSSRTGVGSLEAGWNQIDLSDLNVEIAEEPVNPEHEDIDAVIPVLKRARTL